MQLHMSRTPPGVRELKRSSRNVYQSGEGRTPPGVRELKRGMELLSTYIERVAPLPGCVN